MKLTKPYTTKQYAELAGYANENQLMLKEHIDYIEAVKESEESHMLSNEHLQHLRQSAYRNEADVIKHKWDEAAARNGATSSDAKRLKKEWLSKKDEIRARYPYREEEQ